MEAQPFSSSFLPASNEMQLVAFRQQPNLCCSPLEQMSPINSIPSDQRPEMSQGVPVGRKRVTCDVGVIEHRFAPCGIQSSVSKCPAPRTTNHQCDTGTLLLGSVHVPHAMFSVCSSSTPLHSLPKDFSGKQPWCKPVQDWAERGSVMYDTRYHEPSCQTCSFQGLALLLDSCCHAACRSTLSLFQHFDSSCQDALQGPKSCKAGEMPASILFLARMDLALGSQA